MMMNIAFKRLCGIILVLLVLLSFQKSSAILIADDTIVLYEDGQRITDSSVMYDKYNYAPSCKEGVCHIRQGYNPVRFYKTKEKNVLDYSEWCKINECHSDVHDTYLESVKNSAIYTVTIQIPPGSENKGRVFDVDLKRESIEVVNSVTFASIISQPAILIVLFCVLLLFVLLVLTKFNIKKVFKFLLIGSIIVTLFYLIYNQFVRVRKLGETNVLDGMSACALGVNYNYQVTNEYPPLVRRRWESSTFSDLLTFPDLPSEDDFLKKTQLSKEEALDIVNGKRIYFNDLSSSSFEYSYNYLISRHNVEKIELITARANLCNSQYKGTVDSAIRVVWHIVMKTSKTKVMGITYINPSYDFKWNIFVDAVTGEIINVQQIKASREYVRKPIPPWYTDDTLKKVGSEYIETPKLIY